MQKDKQTISVAEDMFDADNKQSDVKIFTEWLTASAENDACFMPHPNGGMYKRNMSAIQFLYILSNPNENALVELFEKMRRAPMDARNENYILRTFIFVLDLEKVKIDDFQKVLSKELELNLRAKVLCEFIIFDFKNAQFNKLLGGKIQDRALRKIILDGCNALKQDKDNIKFDTLTKKEAISERLEDIRPKRNGRKYTTPVNVLLFINIFLFVFDYIVFSKTGSKPIESFGIQSNYEVLNGEWWRLITSVFLHADVGHLAGNMFMLVFLDRILKNFYTDIQYYIIYILSGIVGSIFTLFMGMNVLSLGASGAIMGLGGVVVFRMFFGKNAKYFRHIVSATTIAIMVLYNLIYGLFNSGINNYAHFSGFIAGFVIAFVMQKTSKRANR